MGIYNFAEDSKRHKCHMCLKEGKEGVSGKLQALLLIKLSFSSPKCFFHFCLSYFVPHPTGWMAKLIYKNLGGLEGLWSPTQANATLSFPTHERIEEGGTNNILKCKVCLY